MATLATAVAAAAAGQQQNYSCYSTACAGQQFQNWKLKAEQAKKVEFIRTAEKLKTQLANVEKDRNGRLYNRRGDFRVEYSILEELERSMTISRKTEKAKIVQQLSEIQNNVKRLQQHLKDVKPTPEFLDKLKKMMEEVENAVNAFKEEQRQIYEQLLKEEKIAINELGVLERKVELWALGNSTTEKLFKLAKSRILVDKTLENHLPKEVVEFERFLQRTGGQQGGWDDYDHQNFLKIWTKHKGKLSHMDEALECGRTREDTEKHDKWYQEFRILHERKKELIKKWKKQQQQEKEENLKEKSRKNLKEEWLQCEESQKQKAEEERKRQIATEAWKKQKAIAFAMEQTSHLKLEDKIKRQERERQHRYHVKLLLESYTLQKKEKEELEKLERKREEAEKEERKRPDAEEITKFQERDLRKMELRILQKQAKEVEKQEKEKRLAKLREKVEIHMARDRRSGLYRPSEGCEGGAKETAPTASERRARILHRAVPTWRQGS